MDLLLISMTMNYVQLDSSYGIMQYMDIITVHGGGTWITWD